MDMDKYIGRLLDNRYEILEVIGIGGMAVVYKARCHRLNRLVAIKILKDDLSQDAEFRQRFHAESQAVAMLSHPNIVSVYDVSTSDDADYIVMELIDGITLKQYMEKKGVLNWKETLHFAMQIAKALDHAHSRGIIHRDIKPHNVMVLKNGSVKVADFGIARVVSKSNTLTKEALGSVHYISPEQAKGGRVDNRSDLYSLGVVMYEMMTGRPPFDGESPVAVAIQHINGKPAMPSTLNPNIPGGLEQIIMRAMAHSAADRYPTAAALLLDMDEFRKDPTILFDYNNPTADMDAATRLGGDSQDSQETAPLPNPQPRRTPSGAGAGGSSGGRSGAPKRRPQGGSGQHSGQNRRPSPRHREEVIEEEEDRSRVATIAIIACVVVVLLAVIILGVVYITNLYQGSMIPVPNLVGMHQDQAMANTDIVVVLDEPIYSDRYEPGYIVSQNPSSGLIAKGGVVRITVSLGPRPSELKMPDLTNVEEQSAKNFLIGQGIKEDHIVVVRQNSATITAGQVISTDPAKDATLSKDQLIRLYVSTGPEVREENMPNVKGMSLDMAVSILNRSGFFNLSYEPVESTFDQNYVVNQSIPAETKINVNTNIVLYYSTGNEATKPTEKPTDPTISTIDPDLKMMVVTIRIPDDVTEAFTLTVWQDGTVVQEMDLPAGTISRQVELTGKGTMTFQFKIGDRLIDEREVNFDE